jgi:hypothetical protein
MENKKAISTVVDNVQRVHGRNSGDVKADLIRVAKEIKEQNKDKKGMYTMSVLMSDEIADIDPRELAEIGFTVRTVEDIERLSKQQNHVKKDM